MHRFTILGREYVSAVPRTPAEAAVHSAGWERRGLLGRLVRLAEPVHAIEAPRRAERRRAA